ncbi:hypothetical protein GCM10025780_34330 [Frondihabitans cladoniiphilus]|uniref:Uncharacterized protein n=1 Tax=Frondihabitans cladoniiphilus TaxID=715785 RepID=A0ABP8WA14_9MICO
MPYIVSPHVLSGTVWGIPKSRAFRVLREDVSVDESVFFTSDQVAIRGVARVGFGFRSLRRSSGSRQAANHPCVRPGRAGDSHAEGH